MPKLVDAAKSKRPGAVEAALDGLGTGLTIRGNQVNWRPPADLEPFVAQSIRESLKALSDQVRAGKLTVDANGDVHVK